MAARPSALAAGLAVAAAVLAASDPLSAEERLDGAATLLRDAGAAVLSGTPAFVALRESLSGHGLLDGHACLVTAWETLEALCGSLAAFDALPRPRRENVLRYALACLTAATDPALGWSPRTTVTADAPATIGEAAWAEVAALARGRMAA